MGVRGIAGSSGGSSTSVQTVNGKPGPDVVLTPSDIGAQPMTVVGIGVGYNYTQVIENGSVSELIKQNTILDEDEETPSVEIEIPNATCGFKYDFNNFTLGKKSFNGADFAGVKMTTGNAIRISATDKYYATLNNQGVFNLNCVARYQTNSPAISNAKDLVTKEYVDNAISSKVSFGTHGIFFIDSFTGDDTTGDGSQEKPFATLSKAQDAFIAGPTLDFYIMKLFGSFDVGTFNQTINNLILVGANHLTNPITTITNGGIVQTSPDNRLTVEDITFLSPSSITLLSTSLNAEGQNTFRNVHGGNIFISELATGLTELYECYGVSLNVTAQTLECAVRLYGCEEMILSISGGAIYCEEGVNNTIADIVSGSIFLKDENALTIQNVTGSSPGTIIYLLGGCDFIKNYIESGSVAYNECNIFPGVVPLYVAPDVMLPPSALAQYAGGVVTLNTNIPTP